MVKKLEDKMLDWLEESLELLTKEEIEFKAKIKENKESTGLQKWTFQ